VQISILNESPISGLHPVDQRAVQLQLELAAEAVHNPADAFISMTYTERGNELDQIIQDAITKYIMSNIDLAEFEGQVAVWRRSGGDQIIQEYNEQYAEVN